MKYLKRYRLQIYGLVILLVIALLQSTLLNHFRIFNVKPDAILATLIIFVFLYSLRWAAIFAFLAGFFRDIFSVLPFGLNIVICILWIILAKQISLRLTIEDKFIRSATLFIIILFNNLALWGFCLALNKPIAIGVFFKIVSLESILTLLLSIPMYRFFVYLLRPPESSFEHRLKF